MVRFYILALFLVSATAVPVGLIRLSDIATGLILLLTTFEALIYYENRKLPFDQNIRILALIIATCSIAWFFQLALADPITIADGYSTAAFVPAAILLSVFLGMTFREYNLPKLVGNISLLYSVLLMLLLLYFIFLPPPLWLAVDAETYEGRSRFSALSNNPNQLQLVLLPLPFFSYLAWRSDNKSTLFFIGEVLSILSINFFTFGKTLFAAWMFCFVPFLYLDLLKKYPNLKVIFMAFGIVALPVAAVESFAVVQSFYTGYAEASIVGQGEDRLLLWQHGLDAWTDSPFIGHGPGAFSGIYGAYEKMEAHNTSIDWLASYGLFGFIPLVCLAVFALIVSIRKRDFLMAGYFIALVIQSTTGFVGRNPFFWIWWLIGLALLSPMPNWLPNKAGRDQSVKKA